MSEKIKLTIIDKLYFVTFFLLLNILNAQHSFNSSSNPVERILNESINQRKNISTIFPSFSQLDTTALNIFFSNKNFYNSGHTNIENNSELIARQFLNSYFNYSMSLYSKFIYLKISPFSKHQSSTSTSDSIIDGTFSYLNDKSPKINIEQNKMGLRQSTLALHYKDIGFGVSNESMWIGPGFHSSLSMSNNSSGFKYYFMGTLRQKKINNIGLDIRYFISERKNSVQSFFHNSLSSSLTFYGLPTITLGFNRTYLSGGFPEIKWSMNDASLLIVEPLFGNNKNASKLEIKYNEEPVYWDPWDQLLVGFVNLYFPLSKTHLYFELGTDDHRANLSDLKAHWDHSIGYILGLKKFGIFSNDFVFIGLEIMSNKTTANTLKSDFFRGDSSAPNFYTDSQYLYSSFEGRRWAAHSGSDSDDKIIMIGFINDIQSILISYNYERRGVVTKNYPEKKSEIILRLRKSFKNIALSCYFENERIYNYNFLKNTNAKKSNVIGIGFDYYFNNY